MSDNGYDQFIHETLRAQNNWRDMSDTCPCTSCVRNRSKKSVELRKNEQGLSRAAALAGINPLPPGSRAGHDARNAGIAHIEEMREGGYLTDTEADTRIGYLRAAQTTKEIQALTSDLPAPRDKRTRTQKVRDDFDMDKPRWYVPVHATSALLFLFTALFPSIIAANDHWWATPHGAWTVIPLMILGAVGFVINVCMAISRAVDGM